MIEEMRERNITPLTHKLTDWLNEWVNVTLMDELTNECMNGIIDEWMNGGLGKCVGENSMQRSPCELNLISV